MLSSMFEAALRERCRLFDLDIRTHDMPWPDEPMEHGYAVQGMDGLKEYMGTADEVVELAGEFPQPTAAAVAGGTQRRQRAATPAGARGGTTKMATAPTIPRWIPPVHQP